MSDDLAQGQERLARTLDRARANEDREIANRVRDEGLQLVLQLNGLLRMARLHSLDNHAFDQPVQESAKSLERLTDFLGTLNLAVVEDQIYLNEIRIRLDERGGGKDLGPELLRHGLGGLRFHAALSEPELRRFVACFAEKPAPVAPRAALKAAVAKAGLAQLELLGPFRVRLAGETAPGAGGVTAAEMLQRQGLVVREAFDSIGHGRHFNPLPLRRAVTEMLAAGLEHEDLVCELPGFAPHVSHALRVCRLALLLGGELGLPPAVLQDLGVAALLHDIGYTDIGAQPHPDHRSWHPASGARVLLRQRGFSVSKVRRVAAVLDHHAAPNSRRRTPSLLARVLQVVEDYDTLVRTGTAPRQALLRIAGSAGTLYDPALTQAFMNALGLYPPGTRVMLPDGRQALVVAPGRKAAGFGRPTVVVNALADGSAPTNPERLDLALLGIDVCLVPVAPPLPATRRAALPLAGQVAQGLPLRLVYDARHEERSGRLYFAAGHERRELQFTLGRAICASSSAPAHDLGTWLVRVGGVEPQQLDWARAEATRTDAPLGRTLVQAGVLDRGALERVLAAQAHAVVADLASWEEGEYRFEPEGAPRADQDVAQGISTDELIAAAVRALDDPDVVRFALGKLDRVPVRTAEIHALEPGLLLPHEGVLLAQVDGRKSARQLLQGSGLPSEQAHQALLTLLALGLADWRG